MSLLYRGSFRMPGSCELYLRAFIFKKTRDINMGTVISNQVLISCSIPRNWSQAQKMNTQKKELKKNPFFFFHFQFVFLCLFPFSFLLSFFFLFYFHLYTFSFHLLFLRCFFIFRLCFFISFILCFFICSFVFWHAWLSFFSSSNSFVSAIPSQRYQ